jgi:hypothetical protein
MPMVAIVLPSGEKTPPPPGMLRNSCPVEVFQILVVLK